jgi:hypothetical protein
MKDILHAFNLADDPTLKAVRSIATEILPVSRIGDEFQLIRGLVNEDPIPKTDRLFSQTLSDVCQTQALSLWNRCDQSINIYWSGGIDSSLALVSLLMTCPEKKLIHVHCNINSIYENPHLYKKLLSLKNVVLKNSSLESDSQEIFVTGDLGDQIFGSELIFKISEKFGFDSVFKPYSEVIFNLFNYRIGGPLGKSLYDFYRPITEKAPFKISTAFDFIWWWNFSHKWQGVKYRKKCFLPDSIQIVHFFDSKDFQLWSLFNHDKKIYKDIESYKYEAKKIIYAFDKGEGYLKYKKKLGSPFSGTIHFYGEYTDKTKILNWNELQSELVSRCNKLI